MEKTSLKLVFLFSLVVLAFCSSLGDARVMTNEEVNCINGQCPEGKTSNYLSSTERIMDGYETNAICNSDRDCIKICKGYKIFNCINQTCFCEG